MVGDLMRVMDEVETKALRAFQALREDPNALQRLSARGIRNFLLASTDGLLIDAVTASKTLDLEEVAADAATTLNATKAKAQSSKLGAVKGIVVEFESGESVVLDPLSEDAMAVYLAESAEGLDQLAREMPHLAPVVAAGHEFLTADEPSAPPAAAAPAASTKAPAVKEAPAPPVARASARPAVRKAAPAPASPALRATDGSKRLILRKAELETVGFTASAVIELTCGEQRAVGRAVGRNIPDQYLPLAAEATIRAITEFLPAGYGIVLENIQPVSSGTEVAVWANVIFITPTEEQLLPGIARLDGQPTLAAAKTILSAVNRRLELVLNQSH